MRFFYLYQEVMNVDGHYLFILGSVNYWCGTCSGTKYFINIVSV